MSLTLPIYLRGRTFVLHFRIRGRQIKRSLHTTDPQIAKIRALKLLMVVQMATKGDNPNLLDFNINLADVRKYKLNPQTGEMETNGTPEDHRNMMEAIDRIGIIQGGFPKTGSSKNTVSGSSKGIKLHEIGFTLSDVLGKFKSLKKSLSEGTMTDYDATVKQFDEWSEKPALDEIDGEKITAYMERLSERGNSERTIDKKIGTLRALFNFAIKHKYYIGENPAAERNLLTRKQKNSGGLNFFKLEDIKQMFDCEAFRQLATADPAFYLITVTGLITGIRVSALAALKSTDLRINLDGDPYIRVKKDKTAAGTRDVPIPVILHRRLKTFLENAGGFGFTARKDGKGASDPIRKLLNEHLEAVGMGDEELTFHGLRKTLNNFFIREKVEFEARCQFMGHEVDHVNVAVYGTAFDVHELAAKVLPSQEKMLALIGFE